MRRRGGFGAMACGVAIGLTMAGGTMLMGQSQRHRLDAEEVWTRKVVIVDEKGRMRGVLGMSRDGSSGFVFCDERGRDRAVLVVKPDGPPTLALNSRDEEARMVAAVDGEDRASVEVVGKDKIGMAASDDEGATIAILRGRKDPVAVWGIDAEGVLDIEPATASGTPRPSAASAPRGSRPAGGP